ncbi:SRPBCC family protein [Brevibacterium casei]|uniref:SRPBCC family protein n=1 Tax=Brevibacterium casei TaxID=33889 RepID=UPI0036FB72F7
MSRFTDSASTSYSLSILAMEEASRVGQREADIDHLFLALTVSEQTAGQVLRSLGITIDDAREAVAAQHAEQLAGLGIRTDPPAPGRIVFHETEGYEWGDRALRILQAANGSGKRGDAAAVLRDLVVEPSGMIESILTRLGTSSEAVLAELDRVERLSDRPAGSTSADALSGTVAAFVPAPIDDVWRLLSDASRLPDWDPTIGSVEDGTAATSAGQSWAARTRSTRRDGTPVTVKPHVVNQRVEAAEVDEPRFIEWRATYPDAARANARRTSISLEPAAGGTQLHIEYAWVRTSTSLVRRLLGLALRPLQRFLIWIQLGQLRAGISRAFR